MRLHLQSSRMIILVAIFSSALAIFLPTSVYSQSVTRTKPTHLMSEEIRGHADFPARIGTGYSKTFYYDFWAGPGIVTLDVLSYSGRGDYSYSVTLEPPAGGTLQHLEFRGSGFGDNVRDTRVSLSTRTHVYMGVNLTGRFEYRITLGGPIDLPRVAATTTATRVGGGTPLSVPATGTLLIRMRDGTAREFDLSLVREVVVVR
jgi:hypothetical protein